MTLTFTARVDKLGINPCVRIPARLSKAFDVRGYVPVAGLLNGVAIRGNLVPIGGFRHRLYLNTDMRTRAKVNVGDRVTITLALDRRAASRPVRVPAALTRTLAASSAAKATWNDLVPSRRKEILAYLSSLKRAESIERNVTRIVAKLGQRKV